MTGFPIHSTPSSDGTNRGRTSRHTRSAQETFRKEGPEARRGLPCLHLETKTQVFALPNIVIERTHWTTYANAGREGDAERGSVYSIDCQVKDGD